MGVFAYCGTGLAPCLLMGPTPSNTNTAKGVFTRGRLLRLCCRRGFSSIDRGVPFRQMDKVQ